MASKAKKITLHDVLTDITLVDKMSDAQLDKLTSDESVREAVTKVRTQVKQGMMSEDGKTPVAAKFAAEVKAVAKTHGSPEVAAKRAKAQRAIERLLKGVTADIIRVAFMRGWVGKGKQWPTQAALAKDLGVTPGYISQNKPAAQKDKTKQGQGQGRKVDTTKREEKATEAAKSDPVKVLSEIDVKVSALASDGTFTAENAQEAVRLLNSVIKHAETARSSARALVPAKASKKQAPQVEPKLAAVGA
jgi:hypothetical protein